MEGQFGALSSSSPSAIYKIDGATGAVTYIADTAFSGVSNTGPGIGGLAYDRRAKLSMPPTSIPVSSTVSASTKSLPISASSTTASPVAALRACMRWPMTVNTWISPAALSGRRSRYLGLHPAGRRIDALAIHDGRLYYAVADGPEIWSVGLDTGRVPRRRAAARWRSKRKSRSPSPASPSTTPAI